MLSHFTRARDAVEDFGMPDVDSLLLTTAHNRRLEAPVSKIKVVQSISKLLQCDDNTLANVRVVVDDVTDFYTLFTTKLFADANIIACPTFESAIVKVHLGSSGVLSREERFQVSQFAHNQMNGNLGTEISLSCAARAFNGQRRLSTNEAAVYSDLRFVLPTSNICKKLFSITGVLQDPADRYQFGTKLLKSSNPRTVSSLANKTEGK